MDLELLKKARHKDAEAFGALIEPYHKLIFKICKYKMGNWHDAEDAVDEVEELLWKKIDTYTWNEDFEKFISKVTVNVCNNIFRFRKAQKRGEGKVISLDSLKGGKDGNLAYDPPDPTQDPEEEVIRKEGREHLRKCIQMLPEKQRNALWLTKIDGLKISVAAITLGVSEGTIKSQVNRALKKLAEMLEKWESESDGHQNQPIDNDHERKHRRK